MGKAFNKSALQPGIKALLDEIWKQNIEKGQKIRVDCTVVEANIHDPYDSGLLVDANRVLNRILATAKDEWFGIRFSFTHHLCRAKHRNL